MENYKNILEGIEAEIAKRKIELEEVKTERKKNNKVMIYNASMIESNNAQISELQNICDVIRDYKKNKRSIKIAYILYGIINFVFHNIPLFCIAGILNFSGLLEIPSIVPILIPILVAVKVSIESIDCYLKETQNARDLYKHHDLEETSDNLEDVIIRKSEMLLNTNKLISNETMLEKEELRLETIINELTLAASQIEAVIKGVIPTQGEIILRERKLVNGQNV